jgi:Mg-chelatase subunit ChlD
LSIFPENPADFAAEFVKRMRENPDVIEKPSSRQVFGILKLINARFFRKRQLKPNDYIQIATVTSLPDNQKIAKKTAFNILFPNYQSEKLKNFFLNGGDLKIASAKDLLSDEDLSELEQLRKLIEETQLSNKVKLEDLQKIHEFMNEFEKNKDYDPYKSALNFFNDESEFYGENIASMEKLMEELKNRIEQKINSLTPEQLKAIQNLDMNELVEQNSVRPWEQITNKALQNRNVEDEINNLQQSGSFDDFIKTLKYLEETEALPKNQLNQLKQKLKDQIQNLDQVFNAAHNFGYVPDFDKEKVFNKSIQQSSFEHNYNLVRTLDQYFGTNLRQSLFEKYNKEVKESQNAPPLDSMGSCSIASSDWHSLFNKSLQKAVEDAFNNVKSPEAFKNLSHQLQKLINAAQNLQCSQKISQKIPDIMKKTLESCRDPSELRDSVEFLRNIGLNPDPKDIERIGNEIGMEEDEIYELIEPNFQILKKLVQKGMENFDRVSQLLNQLKDQLNPEQIKELMAAALGSDNRSALGAIGHFDLKQAVNSAQELGGNVGRDKLISSLNAGDGANLLKQWYLHRNNLPSEAKGRIKELAKKILVDLGIFYSRARIGSSISGPIPLNLVRPYQIGDDFENVDIESTLMNILEKGKRIEYINYDDFLVYETGRGQRSVCFELDISGSMTGEKLAYMAICTVMLIYGMRKDELAIVFFESNTHKVKDIDEDIDLEELADELLSVKARGGTRIQRALEWARNQFQKKGYTKEKINVLFTDAAIYDFHEAADELKKMKSLNIKFILVVPYENYDAKFAKKLAKISGGQLLTVRNWEEFPKLIADIIADL